MSEDCTEKRKSDISAKPCDESLGYSTKYWEFRVYKGQGKFHHRLMSLFMRSEYIHCCVVNVTDNIYYDYHPERLSTVPPDLVVGFFADTAFFREMVKLVPLYEGRCEWFQTWLMYMKLKLWNNSTNNCVNNSRRILRWLVTTNYIEGNKPYDLAQRLLHQPETHAGTRDGTIPPPVPPASV